MLQSVRLDLIPNLIQRGKVELMSKTELVPETLFFLDWGAIEALQFFRKRLKMSSSRERGMKYKTSIDHLTEHFVHL